MTDIEHPSEKLGENAATTDHMQQASQDYIQPQIVQVNKTESEGPRFEAETGNINNRIEKHKGLLAPDHWLPADVVAEIFLAAIGDNLQSFSFPTVQGVTTSLSLSQICSAWRDVALSTPRMWLRLELGMSEESAYPLAKHWFSHSGDALPLSLTCFGTTVMLLGIVIPYMSRWQQLDLDTSETSLISISHNGSFALLEALTLRFDRAPTTSIVERFFTDAPSLRRLCLPAQELEEGTLISMRTPPIILPWHQLTHYESGHLCDVEGALQQLSLCPNLKECRMAVGRELGLGVHSAQVWLPQLRSLHLKCSGYVSSLLANLYLPILQDFKFTGYQICMPSWPAVFTQMIHQSGCSIERISIKNIFTEPQFFIEALHLMPELRELELIQEADWTHHTAHHYLNEDGLSSLTESGQPESELLVPALESLKMEGDFLLKSFRLVDLVESRWNLRNTGDSVKQLKTAQIPIPRNDLGGSLTKRLEKMQTEGLDLTIMPYDPVVMVPGILFP